MNMWLNSWQVWALLAAIFAALTTIFAKFGVTGLNSNYATLIRTLVVVIVLGFWVITHHQYSSLKDVPSKALVFLVLSALATTASWAAYYRALQMGNATGVAALDKLSVVFVAILSVTFLGDDLSWKNWLGVVMIACGAILMVK